VTNVDDVKTERLDKMETFFLVRWFVCLSILLFFLTICLKQSETLKYLYLLFSDDSLVPLDREFPI